MKRNVNAKIAIRCGRAMSRLFYKFPISTNPLKFTEMQLLDDDDLGTMMEICPISQHCGFDFNLNIGWTDQSDCGGTLQMPKNPNYGGSSYNNHVLIPRLQLHLEVICIDANVRERSDNYEDSDHDVEDFSNLDFDEVSDDIDNEGSKEVEDVHAPSFGNLSRGIILWNDLRAHMLNVDPDVVHAPEYVDIVLAHRLASNSQLEELFVGKRFENKADCTGQAMASALNVVQTSHSYGDLMLLMKAAELQH
ncbi:hypothetical protein Gotur_012780, partial [Gossypium turneri]